MGSVSEGMTYTKFPSASLGSPTGIFGTREEMEKLLHPEEEEKPEESAKPGESASSTDITSPTPNSVVNDIIGSIFH